MGSLIVANSKSPAKVLFHTCGSVVEVIGDRVEIRDAPDRTLWPRPVYHTDVRFRYLLDKPV